MRVQLNGLNVSCCVGQCVKQFRETWKVFPVIQILKEVVKLSMSDIT